MHVLLWFTAFLQCLFFPLVFVIVLVQCGRKKKPESETTVTLGEKTQTGKSVAQPSVPEASVPNKPDQKTKTDAAEQVESTDLNTNKLPPAHSPPRTGIGAAPTTPAPSAATSTDRKEEKDQATQQSKEKSKETKEAPEATAEPAAQNEPKIEKTMMFSVKNKKFSDEPVSADSKSKEGHTARTAAKGTTHQPAKTGVSAVTTKLPDKRECKTQKSITPLQKESTQKPSTVKK